MKRWRYIYTYAYIYTCNMCVSRVYCKWLNLDGRYIGFTVNFFHVF